MVVLCVCVLSCRVELLEHYLQESEAEAERLKETLAVQTKQTEEVRPHYTYTVDSNSGHHWASLPPSLPPLGGEGTKPVYPCLLL